MWDRFPVLSSPDGVTRQGNISSGSLHTSFSCLSACPMLNHLLICIACMHKHQDSVGSYSTFTNTLASAQQNFYMPGTSISNQDPQTYSWSLSSAVTLRAQVNAFLVSARTFSSLNLPEPGSINSLGTETYRPFRKTLPKVRGKLEGFGVLIRGFEFSRSIADRASSNTELEIRGYTSKQMRRAFHTWHAPHEASCEALYHNTVYGSENSRETYATITKLYTKKAQPSSTGIIQSLPRAYDI